MFSCTTVISDSTLVIQYFTIVVPKANHLSADALTLFASDGGICLRLWRFSRLFYPSATSDESKMSYVQVISVLPAA